jgi:hypothetical protein
VGEIPKHKGRMMTMRCVFGDMDSLIDNQMHCSESSGGRGRWFVFVSLKYVR